MPLPRSLWLTAGLALMSAACAPASGGRDAAGSSAGGSAADWSTLKDFTAVEATGPDDVVITRGEAFSIRVEGDAGTIEKLDIRRSGDRLEIGRKGGGGFWSGNRSVTIHIRMPDVSALSLTGSGNMRLDEAEGGPLKLALTGTGELNVDRLHVGRLDADVTGSGDMTLGGSADSATLSVTGTGGVDGQGLRAGKAEIAVLGTGDVALASDGPVAIRIMGTGDVTVKGKAQCKVERMGTGEAHCAP